MAMRAAEDGSYVDQFYAKLREEILSGKQKPDARLVLSELSQEHGISLIPIREALRLLEAERLVILEPNRGARVAPFLASEVRDIYATRILLERHALKCAYPSLDHERLEVAQDELHEMKRCFIEGEERAAYRHHQDFHFSLYGPGSSPWTLRLIEQLWGNAERYVRQAAGARPSTVDFVAEHESILEAIKAGQVEEAADLLEENLATTARLLGDHYEAASGRS